MAVVEGEVESSWMEKGRRVLSTMVRATEVVHVPMVVQLIRGSFLSRYPRFKSGRIGDTWIYLDDVMNCFLIPQYNNIFFLDNVRMYYSCLIMSPVSDQIHDGHVDVMILYVNVK